MANCYFSETIITSFPRGWDEDEHGALRTHIRKHILDDRRPRFSSVYEMAALITSLCIGFALNEKLNPCAERLLPIFSAHIAKAVGGILAVVRVKIRRVLKPGRQIAKSISSMTSKRASTRAAAWSTRVNQPAVRQISVSRRWKYS